MEYIQCVFICLWPLLLSLIFVRVTHLVVCRFNSFIFMVV